MVLVITGIVCLEKKASLMYSVGSHCADNPTFCEPKEPIDEYPTTCIYCHTTKGGATKCEDVDETRKCCHTSYSSYMMAGIMLTYVGGVLLLVTISACMVQRGEQIISMCVTG